MALPPHPDLGDEWGRSPQGRGPPSEPLGEVSHGDWIASAMGITSSWTPPQPALSLSRLSLAAKAVATAVCCAPDASSAPRGEGSGRGGGSGGRFGSRRCSVLDRNGQKMWMVEESDILWRVTSLWLVLPEESCAMSPTSHVPSDPLSMEDESWAVVRGPHLHTVACLGGEGGGVATIGLTHPCTAPSQRPAWGGWRGSVGKDGMMGWGKRHSSSSFKS